MADRTTLINMIRLIVDTHFGTDAVRERGELCKKIAAYVEQGPRGEGGGGMTPGERLPRGTHGAGADDFCRDGCTQTHWIKRDDAVNAIAAAIAEDRGAWRNLLIPDPSSSLDPQRAVEAHDATVREMARREAREACVQALIGEMYRVDADEIAEFGPSLPANEVIKTCIAAIRAQP